VQSLPKKMRLPKSRKIPGAGYSLFRTRRYLLVCTVSCWYFIVGQQPCHHNHKYALFRPRFLRTMSTN
jgi:hypothetical protein